MSSSFFHSTNRPANSVYLRKAPLLQFYRLVPHETPPPGSLSEDSLLLPGRHQFELVGDVGFRDLNPTPSFSRTHASHEFVRRGFERLSSRQLKPRVRASTKVERFFSQSGTIVAAHGTAYGPRILAKRNGSRANLERSSLKPGRSRDSLSMER